MVYTEPRLSVHPPFDAEWRQEVEQQYACKYIVCFFGRGDVEPAFISRATSWPDVCAAISEHHGRWPHVEVRCSACSSKIIPSTKGQCPKGCAD